MAITAFLFLLPFSQPSYSAVPYSGSSRLRKTSMMLGDNADHTTTPIMPSATSIQILTSQTYFPIDSAVICASAKLKPPLERHIGKVRREPGGDQQMVIMTMMPLSRVFESDRRDE